MNGVFSSRKENFIHSLERAISMISSDNFVIQMFQDQHSAMYVPDRICEIIRQILSSDREEEIFELYNKIYAIEFFFDEEKIKQIENLGKKYITPKNNNPNGATPNNNFAFGFGDIPDYDGKSISSNQNNEQIVKKKKEDILAFYNILNHQMINLDVDNNGDNNIKINNNNNQVQQIPRVFNELKKNVHDLKRTISSMQNDFATLLDKTKRHSLKLFQITSEKVRDEFVLNIKKAKYVITKQNEQIKKLSSENNLNSKYDPESISTLEDNFKKMKLKLQQSEEKFTNSNEAINSLQQQILLLTNEKSELEEKISKISEENLQLSNFLNEKQKRIDFLEQSLSNIESEIPETDQMNKIKEKMSILNDTIKKIQNENDSLLKKSSSHDITISNLMNLTNTARETDLVTKVDRLYKEKVKICQILNRSLHSDTSKAVEAIHQTHEALKSILNISDETRLISEVQQLKESKKKFVKISEKDGIISDLSKIVNAQNDEQLKMIIQSLQRIKIVFEQLCLDGGIASNSASFNLNLPEIASNMQKSLQTVKDVKSILNLKSQSSIKETLSELLEMRDKVSQICAMFNIKNNSQKGPSVPINKLVKVSKSLVKMKESYDIIVHSLNSDDDSSLISDLISFDEVKAQKAQKNAKLFNQFQSVLKNITVALKIEYQPSSSNKIKSSALITKIKSLVKNKSNYEKVLALLGIDEAEIANDEYEFLAFEKATQIIHSLRNSKKSNESIISSNNNSFRSSFTANQSRHQISKFNGNDDDNLESQILKTFSELCSIFKVSQPESISAYSLSSVHRSLCSIARSILESHSRNLSSIYNISIRLKHFKQVSRNLEGNSSIVNNNDDDGVVVGDDLRLIENEIIQIMNDLSNIYVCFGTSDLSEIKMMKKLNDSEKVGVRKLFQFTGKETIEGSIEFLSKYFNSIEQSSSFLGKLFRILLLLPSSFSPSRSSQMSSNYNFDSGSSGSPVLTSVDEIPLPFSKDVQERLINLATRQKFEKNQLKKAVEKAIEKARSFGFSMVYDDSIEDIVIAVESALNFIIEKVKNEVRCDFESSQVQLEKRLSDSAETKFEYKSKIEELTQTIDFLNKKNSESEVKHSIELQDLRKKISDMNNALENEKKVHVDLMEVLSGKRTDTQYLRSKLSANELLLLSKAEKTRKLVEEMKKKKDESQRILSLQKKTREDFQKNNF
ncbi:hypothetical protein M9Y10_028796 [Tritrichomonas musculus]|uniref:Uncharacterized protein n=1 Tax=Tritrichomonas musculus TaxID=1915356 RepID=A0ABR2KKW7_9EUKA